jgi:hypothetical protein
MNDDGKAGPAPGETTTPQSIDIQTAGDAAATLRELLATVDAGAIDAEPPIVSRIEGAVIVLEAVAAGRIPGPEEFVELLDEPIIARLAQIRDNPANHDRWKRVADYGSYSLASATVGRLQGRYEPEGFSFKVVATPDGRHAVGALLARAERHGAER